MSILAERLLTIDDALATIPHAFGGAIALAYCTGEPRGTIDLDINIFLAHEQAQTALSAMPGEVTVTAANRRELATIGQTRAWWGDTPIDLFFNTDPFHTVAASRVRLVPFRGRVIPVLDCTTIAVFKVLSNRTKDWADLETMAEAGQLNPVAVGALVHDLLGEDSRLQRLAGLDAGP